MSPAARTYRIDVLTRALDVLDHLGGAAEPQSLSQISASLELDRTRVFRILETLRERGYVERTDPAKAYRLGSRILDLKTGAVAAMSFPQIALPRMRTLSVTLQDSISLGVLEGAYVRYVARAPFRRIISTEIDIGTLLPAHATSMGKLLLAQLTDSDVRAVYRDNPPQRFTPKTITDIDTLVDRLAEIRERDVAVVDEELEPGLWGIAVPVRDGTGSVIAALSASVPLAREPRATELAPALATCARQIMTDMSTPAPARKGSGATGH